MNALLKSIRNIRTIHKVAIAAFALGCLAFASTQVSKQRDLHETLLKSDYEQCLHDNPTDTAAREKCQFEKSEKIRKLSDDEIIYAYTGTILLGVALFPAYLIFYNIFCITKFGYKNRYDHSKMNKKEKFLHFFGMAYFSIIILFIIIYHENSLVEKKIGNHLPLKSFTYIDFEEFGDKQAALLRADGIWTNNAIPIKDLNFKNMDYDNYVTEIKCWEEKGKCDHAISDNNFGENYHVTNVDYKETQIEYWGSDKIISIDSNSCANTKYTFDLKNEFVTREVIKNVYRPNWCGNVEEKSFTLSDGVDVEMAIENNEAGPMTSAVLYILGGIFK